MMGQESTHPTHVRSIDESVDRDSCCRHRIRFDFGDHASGDNGWRRLHN